MPTNAKKSVPSTGTKKSYDSSSYTGGNEPQASGKGMDKDSQRDHALMTNPGEQKGKYQGA